MKLKVKDLTFSYRSNPILNGVTLEIEPSELFAIVGPNGTGKTTLIKCIDAILKPTSGSTLLDGDDVSDLDTKDLAKRIGYVPQSAPRGSPITVFDAILMGRRPHIQWRVTEDDLDKVMEMVELLKIEELSLRAFDELSGGERQKVLIARALCQDPEVLLLDEPTSNLDIRHQLEVMKVMKMITKKHGILAIMAIHDLNLASRYADRIGMMYQGRIEAVGASQDVLTPENIRRVYGVEVSLINDGGKPYIIPIEPVEVRA